MRNLHFEPPAGKDFTVSVCIRDHLGRATGRMKEFSTDSPYKLWEFWERNRSRPKRKKKNKNKKAKPVVQGGRLPTDKEAANILTNMYKDRDSVDNEQSAD